MTDEREEIPCRECDGKGKDDCYECGGDGSCTHCGMDRNCPECGGDGEQDCSDCDGTGTVPADTYND